MKKWVVASLLIGLFVVWGRGTDPRHLEYGFTGWMWERLPGGYFFPSVLENYFPDTVLLIEESGGFSLADNPRVYFEGNPQTQFNWYFDRYRLNSALHSGAPAVVPPLSLTSGFILENATPLSTGSGMHFTSPDVREKRLTIGYNTVIPDLGSYSALGPIMVFNHARNRDQWLYESRRKYRYNHIFDSSLHRPVGERGSLSVGGTYYHSGRQFNDFNRLNSTFPEDSELLMLGSRLQNSTSRGGQWDLFTLINLQSRSNQDAELGRYPQETTDLDRLSVVAGGGLHSSALSLKTAITWEKEDVRSSYPNYGKDLMDNDGEGIGIDNRLGDFSSLRIDCSVEGTEIFSGGYERVRIIPYGQFTYTGITGKEWTHEFNPLYFDGSPYLVLRWENPGAEYTFRFIQSSAGGLVHWVLGKSVEARARLFIDYQGFFHSAERNNFSFLIPGFDAGILLFPRRKTSLLTAFGIIPYRVSEDAGFFLETRRPGGAYYHWTDSNHNSMYEEGETGLLYGYTGGPYHHLDPEFEVPRQYRFLLSMDSVLGTNWRLTLKGIYKQIVNSQRIRFHENYGSFSPAGSVDVFFYDRPFQNYYLSNLEKEADPFYAQLSILLRGQKPEKWFFNFSFLAHIGMGYTPFGNGAGTSDTGLISESMANPNSLFNSYGRLDGDRAFVGRCFFGFYLFNNCFLAMGLKYRDGNPFAFIGSSEIEEQIQFYYRSIKAEDQYGNKPGPREDYLSEINIRLGYTLSLMGRPLDLSLSVFNILDFGSELSEWVFLEERSRLAAELQIPRSILFSARLRW